MSVIVCLFIVILIIQNTTTNNNKKYLFKQKMNSCPGHVAGLVEGYPIHKAFAGLIPSQGT